MDLETIKAYSIHSDYFFRKYSSSKAGISKYFSLAFKDCTSILDIGAGSGNDMNQLAKMGYEVTGVEPSDHLVSKAYAKFPSLRGKIFIDHLPELRSIAENQKFDGILCAAILMHIPHIQIFDSLNILRNRLKDGGRLLISIPKEYPNADAQTSRDQFGRLYNGLTAGQVSLILNRLGLRLLYRWEDVSAQNGIDIIWTTLFFTYEGQGKARAIDSIEAILNKDKKVATYKLALFRALAEVAGKNINSAKWKSEGYVLLPIELVVDKWIEYYWPIFESADFIPQIQRESIEYSRPVSFRKYLTRLTDHYKRSGGYEAFHIDKMKMKLNASILRDIGALKVSIKKTLIKGPIRHAGGYNIDPLLDYDRTSDSIIIPENIWTELTMLGNWIIDTTILRWAELTSKFSKGKMKPSSIIDLLLIEEKTRQINDARIIYTGLTDLRCTWTSDPIQRFEVDHVIPFSLWKNNDLWNLVPAKTSVNRDKSDRLVSDTQLIKSKDLLIHYWEQSVEKEEYRFLNEARILSGKKLNASNWKNELFNRLREAVEYTAIQRGIERWET